eukprot:359425-Chlamydomonas_euryale.AAC.2
MQVATTAYHIVRWLKNEEPSSSEKSTPPIGAPNVAAMPAAAPACARVGRGKGGQAPGAMCATVATQLGMGGGRAADNKKLGKGFRALEGTCMSVVTERGGGGRGGTGQQTTRN